MEIKEIGAYKSQDKKHGFDFIFEGEIRFGPTYYKIKLDGQLIENRIFGFEFKWHPNSTFLALQEWLTTDYQKGPITTLTLIDLQNGKLARISTADKGFIKPIEFNNQINGQNVFQNNNGLIINANFNIDLTKKPKQ